MLPPCSSYAWRYNQTCVLFTLCKREQCQSRIRLTAFPLQTTPTMKAQNYLLYVLSQQSITMTNSNSAKRKRNAQAEASRKVQKMPSTVSPSPDTTISTDPKRVETLVSADELETTADTLKLLSEYPNVIKSKQCKELRAAVYSFRQACNTGMNAACRIITLTCAAVY